MGTTLMMEFYKKKYEDVSYTAALTAVPMAFRLHIDAGSECTCPIGGRSCTALHLHILYGRRKVRQDVYKRQWHNCVNGVEQTWHSDVCFT